MKLFVTGASGFIGSRFCELAIDAGHEIWGLVRAVSAARIPPRVQRVYGSLPYDLRESVVKDCDVIVHLAAVTTSRQAGEAQSVNQYGTEYLVRLAQAYRKDFLFISTQSAHGNNPSTYAATKRSSEELIKASGLNWVIVRPGLVYGPGNYGLFARMRKSVMQLPVMPLLGGGKALVQPVHVDDLCQAMLTILGDSSSFAEGEFNLGDPEGLSLKDFLQDIAKAGGKQLRQVTVPLAPVRIVVAGGEKMGLPLPISMDNLRGLETVQRMDTQPSLDRLGLELRPLGEGLKQSAEPVRSVKDDRIPVILVGAGKIGIVHGLQLLYNPASRLAGIVKPNQKAAKLYRSMGFDAPFYPSILDALAGEDEQPVAAVIATPADTHLPVAKQCLEAGLNILVEKPLSISKVGADEWRLLREQYPDKIIHSGYMAAQFPHLLTAYHFARMNKLGHIYKASAVALQTHITASEPVRWEMLKNRAGGGVMINFGCHIAAMLFRLLGWPDSEVHGWQWSVYSKEVEDAVVAQFSIKSTQCTLIASWSVPGFARPYNLVELECEHGIVKVENSCVYVIQDGVATLLETQLDYDLPFNMAPDYTGGGFALEHEAFVECVRSMRSGNYHGTCKSDFMPPVEMAEALRLESWIRNVYATLIPEKPDVAQLQGINADTELLQRLLAAGERQ